MSETRRFGLFVLAGCLFSVYLGKDLNWDLLNYHYYNPWALLHGRRTIDLFPAQSQTLFNPLIDLPFYVAARHWPDHVVVFLMGAPFGAATYLVWKLTAAQEAPAAGRAARWQLLALRVAITGLAVSGAAGLAQANSTTGEWVVAALILAGVWGIVSAGVADARAWDRRLALGGLLLGMAVGLKLNAAVPVVGFTVALPLLRRPDGLRLRLRGAVGFALAGILGFLILAGPWMWLLQRDYQSPLFPFFNGVFRSPWLEDGSMLDRRFLPQEWADVLKLPFYALLVKNTLHSEFPIRDPRLLIGCVVAVPTLLAMLRPRWRAAVAPRRVFLAVVFLVIYFVWIRLFGIYRYAILLEILALLLLHAVLIDLLRRGAAERAAAAALLSLGSAALLTVAPNLGHVDVTGKRYFSGAALPPLPKGAMLLSMSDSPVGYMAALWPGRPAFVVPMSNLSSPGHNDGLQRMIARRVLDHPGPHYVMLDGQGELSAPARYLLLNYALSPDMASCMPARGAEGSIFRVCRLQPRTVDNALGFDVARQTPAPTLIGGYFPADAPDGGVWTGAFARVVASRAVVDKGMDLVIEAGIPEGLLVLADPRAPLGVATVWINGVVVKVEPLRAGHGLSMRIPASVVRSAAEGFPSVGVQVRVSREVVPAAAGLGPDQRALGMSVRRIAFESPA